MKTMKIIMALTMILISGATLANEPTEKEMISAIQNEINGYYAGGSAMEQGCDRIRESENPFNAIGCLIGKTRKMAKLSVKSFEKIGCAKAKATGYYCDYRVSVNTGGFFGPMDNLGGGITTRRFINTRSGWAITN